MSREIRPVWLLAPYTLAIDPSELQIVSWPDPRLRTRATYVPTAEEVAVVAPRMVELMHEASGIGLAAPQVGLPRRMFVTYVPDADPIDRFLSIPCSVWTFAEHPLSRTKKGASLCRTFA